MASIMVIQARVELGKEQEFVALRREMKELAAKYGLNTRLVPVAHGGRAGRDGVDGL